MNILYVGKTIEKIESGADAINKRNLALLNSISEGNIYYVSPTTKSFRDKSRFGISNEILIEVSNLIHNCKITHIFLSQSLLGRIAKFIHNNYPAIQIITFCHNIELDYAKAYLNSSGIKGLPFFMAVKYWEKKAIAYSSKIITLNKRDSHRLYQLYGVESSLALPTSFNDEFDKDKALYWCKCKEEHIDYLFVGVAFFPNINGIQWFIDEVLPNVKGDLYIIGKGMDKVSFRNINKRVHIIGYVDDLSEYYYKARCVVSPIFTGAGMKTKTAEALMYGKNIVGTSEAFEGYEINSKCMRIANSAKEFIEEINTNLDSFENLYNEYSRSLFLEHYNTEKQKEKLKSIFQVYES